jgi:hypothetical protein
MMDKKILKKWSIADWTNPPRFEELSEATAAHIL